MVRMHHLALLLSNFSLQVITSFQITTECTIYRPYFQTFLGFPDYRFKQHPNAPIPVLIFPKKSRMRARGLLHAPFNEVKACAVSFHGSIKYRFKMCHNYARESVLVLK